MFSLSSQQALSTEIPGLAEAPDPDLWADDDHTPPPPPPPPPPAGSPPSAVQATDPATDNEAAVVPPPAAVDPAPAAVGASWNLRCYVSVISQ